jgi:hypothetical protein
MRRWTDYNHRSERAIYHRRGKPNPVLEIHFCSRCGCVRAGDWEVVAAETVFILVVVLAALKFESWLR